MPLPRPKLSRGKKPRRPKAATWTWLLDLKEVEGVWCEGEVLNLPGWKTIKYKETSHDVIVLAELTTEVEGPCECGAPMSKLGKWGFTDPSYVRDVPIRCKRVRLYYRLQRKRCTGCGQTVQQALTGIHEKPAFTNRLVEYIQRESFNPFRSFSGVADETGVHELAVRNLFTARAKQLENLKLVETPEWLSIDEVYPKKKNEPRCVIAAPERRRVLDLLPDNKWETLAEWLLNLPDRHSVKVVTIDMYETYRSAVRRLLPNTDIVVDRYHVHNLLSVALRQVMEVVRDSMTYTECRQYMRREALLLKNYRRLSKKGKKGKDGKNQPSEQELVKKWLEDVPDIATAYWLVKDFSDILQLTDRQKAEELTDLWLERACEFVNYFRAKYEKGYRGEWKDPFGNVPNTITGWRANILNYIKFKGYFGINATNGFAEFANKQIKFASRVGNYTFQVLRLKVVYGGILVKKRPPHPLDEKKTRKRKPRVGAGDKEEICNPDANGLSLERARRERYETANLLPRPQENPGWSARFEPTNECRPSSSSDERESDAGLPEAPPTGETDQPQNDTVGRSRRPFKFNPNQGTLF